MSIVDNIESKLNIFSISILSLGGIGALTLGIYQTYNGLDKPILLIIGLPFLIFGICCIYWALTIDILTVTKNELIIKAITGKTKWSITLKELTSYSEIKKENTKFKSDPTHAKWKDLILMSNNFKYGISSVYYSNYNELRLALTKGLKRDTQSEFEWKRKNSLKWGYSCVILGSPLAFLLLKNGISDYNIKTLLIVIGFIVFFFANGISIIIKNKKPAGNKS